MVLQAGRLLWKQSCWPWHLYYHHGQFFRTCILDDARNPVACTVEAPHAACKYRVLTKLLMFQLSVSFSPFQGWNNIKMMIKIIKMIKMIEIIKMIKMIQMIQMTLCPCALSRPAPPAHIDEQSTTTPINNQHPSLVISSPLTDGQSAIINRQH